MKFKVTITQTHELEVEIEAPTAAEAEEAALIMLGQCEISFPEYFNGEDLEAQAEPCES